MNGLKSSFTVIAVGLSVTLIASVLSVTLVTRHDLRRQYDVLNTICGEIVEQDPETKRTIAAALKAYTSGNAVGAEKTTSYPHLL